MIDRQEVEALLVEAERGERPITDSRTMAALCRAWLAVQEGWVLVPPQSTWEMEQAAAAVLKSIKRDKRNIRFPAREMYDAMLTAAPSPEQEKGGPS